MSAGILGCSGTSWHGGRDVSLNVDFEVIICASCGTAAYDLHQSGSASSGDVTQIQHGIRTGFWPFAVPASRSPTKSSIRCASLHLSFPKIFSLFPTSTSTVPMQSPKMTHRPTAHQTIKENNPILNRHPPRSRPTRHKVPLLIKPNIRNRGRRP